MNKINNKYSVPQEILYSVCLAAWNLCSQNLAKFTALKAYYTEIFITKALQDVQAAKQLPQAVQTVAWHKEARIELINAAIQVHADWQLLKLYIVRAFAADMVQAKLNAAGASLYARKSFDNWSAVRSLIDTATSFITDNLVALTANGNMPEDFRTKFQNDGNNCIERSMIFTQAKMDKQMATSAKAEANNSIYTSAIEMLKDGQQIFRNDAAVKKQFTFSYLVSMYQGEGAASLKGYVVNDLNLPVEGATVISADQSYSATTNAKGYYRITRIARGAYTFSITCPGYIPLMQQIIFKAGVAGKGDFELEGEMKKVA